MKTHTLKEWIKAGDYYRGKENFAKAIEAYVQARLALLADMAECFTRLGELEDARVLFEEIVEADVRNARANAGLGIVYLLAGFPEEAALAFSNVLHVDPHESKALCGLGMTRLQQGRYDEGVKLLLQALDEKPDNLAALVELAGFARKPDGAGYRMVALERCRTYLARHPEASEVRDHVASLESGGSGDGYLASLVEAFRSDPYRRETVLALAATLGRAGQRQDARNVCSVYLQRYPSDDGVLSLQRTL